MSRASCGRSLLKTSINLSNLAFCCRKFAAAGLVASFFQSQMHALMATILLGVSRFYPLDADSQAQPPHREFAQVKQGVCRSEGHAIVAADVGRQAALFKKSLKHSKSKVFFGGGERLADQQIPTRMIGDGQRVAVVMIPQQELALVIGTP